MAEIGDYSERYIWWKQSRTLDPDYNQPKETFQNNGRVWAYTVERTATEILDYGTILSETFGTIHVRHFPAISTKDELENQSTGDRWIIDGIAYGDGELVITAHRRKRV